MSENMERFVAAVREDDELMAQLIYAGKEEAVEIAKEAGYSITAADMEAMEAELKAAMKAASKARKKGELSDDELDSVAGGIEVFHSVFHKHGWMFRLTDAEIARFEAKGYTLVSNGAYKKGDYYDVLKDGCSLVDLYLVNPVFFGNIELIRRYAIEDIMWFATGQRDYI